MPKETSGYAALSESWLPEQVFRTYNASITLDALLNKESTATTVDEKKAEYDRANKEVSLSLVPWGAGFRFWD